MKWIVPLFSFLFFSSSLVNATICEPQQIIEFADGTQGCMTSYSLPKSKLPNCKDPIYTTSPLKNANNCFGTIFYNAYRMSSEKYIGEIKDNMPNGFGTYYFPSGNVYIGQHQNGSFHGQGILIHNDGSQTKEGIWESSTLKLAQKINFQTTNVSEVDQKSKPIENNKVQSVNEVEINPTISIAVTPLAQIPSALSANSDQQPLVAPFKNVEVVKLEQERIALAAQKVEFEMERKKFSDLQKANSKTEKISREAEVAVNKKIIPETQLKLTSPNAEKKEVQNSSTSSVMTSSINRRALVIGNDSYKSVPKLSNAREDARTIASNLSSLGYQVTLKLDLTEREMKSSLRTFASQVEGGDEVLFFYAGHGVQLGASNYLLPVDILGDSEAQVKDEAIQLQRVLDDMSDRKAKFTLAVIDACRDNPFKSSGRSIGGRGLAPTTAATGQMVIFAAGTGQQALDKLNNVDKNKNGLFTRVFVQEMQKPNISIDRVVKNVRNQVAALAKSVGHEQVPAIYDQVLGDFYFIK